MFAHAFLLGLALTAAEPPRPFAIEVVDQQTGRGVPLIELTTTNEIRHVTDSNGLVAFDEPGLMGQTVFFHVKGHGYEYPKDGFGYRGKALKVEPGGSARLEVARQNIAERLYRVTGAGIYSDTIRLGRSAPIRQPLLNAQVLGSDSVLNAIYHGRLAWFWGDTNRPGYPLGNFHTPGATSQLPAQGGLDPERGVDLSYFTNPETGFAKETCKMPGGGPTWIGGLVVLKEKDGRERMYAGYVKVKPPMVLYEHGLVLFHDETQSFEKVATFPEDAPISPQGHTLIRKEADGEYVYFTTPYPFSRVKADADSLAHIERYEGYTCLKPGTRPAQAQIDRDSAGRARYGWKANTPPLGLEDQDKLVKSGALKEDERLLIFRDVTTGKTVRAHGGSVCWNDHRKRWVMIFVEVGGTSYLGEVWYAEADALTGPWVERARSSRTTRTHSTIRSSTRISTRRAGG